MQAFVILVVVVAAALVHYAEAPTYEIVFHFSLQLYASEIM